MSLSTALPASARRLFRKPTTVGFNGLGTPGQKAVASETWQVLMADRLAALNVVYGSLEVVGGFNGAVVRRVPLRHPEFPTLLATDCTAVAKGWDSTLTAATYPNGFWKYIDLTVQFSSMPYDLSGQNAFLSLNGNPSSRQIPGPASGFRLNAQAPIFDPGEDANGEDFGFTTHQLATLPMSVYDSCRECVNSTAFPMPNGNTRPVGTVLYRGPSYNQTNNLDGTSTWEVSHAFSYSRLPWNWYFVNGVQYEMTRADGSRKYPLADLTAVFNAG